MFREDFYVKILVMFVGKFKIKFLKISLGVVEYLILEEII